MGVLNGRDLFSAKWVTAIVITPYNTWHAIPIKKTLGQYWLARINGQTYAFRLDGARVLTRDASAVRPVRILIYHMGHTHPLGDTSAIDAFLRDNRFGRINRAMVSMLRLMGYRQKHDKKTGQPIPVDVKELQEKVNQNVSNMDPANTALDPDVYETHLQLKEFLDDLPQNKVVGDTRSIVEYLNDDLLATSPGFFGDIVDHLKIVEYDHRIITNVPKTAQKDWAKMLAILMGIAGIGMAFYFAWQSGALDGIFSGNFSLPGMGSMPTLGGGSMQNSDWVQRWPDLGELKMAVDNGTVSRSSLPPDLREMIANLPDAEPRP